MPLNALVRVERAERYELDGPGTVAAPLELPRPVTVVNISRSGCLLRGASGLAAGAAISVGIPGIGARAAHITRLTPDGYGCAFEALLSAAEVELAMNSVLTAGHARPEVIRSLRRLKADQLARAEEDAPPPSLWARLRRRFGR
ncbi:PilZ domain-containing protein [Sphingomonas morindae]|uniref:PilZ domain-containing protein n=1 Tax=Sphingomonas morindae TaxID=1541170 RepID=A0ABY4X8E0_9SPHN|nr:PilZ domain-containing protein [Sphingomonas morindae]USI73179.1 PilZ domain-containing protein [Sphingomonas morindae]